MPRFNGTGPQGFGPMTGRGMGPCGGGYGPGRGFGGGRGFGAGYGRGFRQRPWTKDDEIASLEDEEKALQEEIKGVKEDIEYLKNQK